MYCRHHIQRHATPQARDLSSNFRSLDSFGKTTKKLISFSFHFLAVRINHPSSENV